MSQKEQKDTKPMTPEQQKAFIHERLSKVAKNHPDCIPVFFMRHPESPDTLKHPAHPFILFKKSFKIENAMISLYNQIKQKGLYFFCPYLSSKDELKYSILKPGPTIEDVYKRFGRGGYLTVVYADKNIGMGGLMKMEKWVIRLLVMIVFIWVSLYGYSYYLQWQSRPKGVSEKQVIGIQDAFNQDQF